MDTEIISIHDKNRPKVNIQFQDLKYTVYRGKEEKCILKSINGEFKSKQVSAIMGPSGSGKTTLLNILAGYKMANVSGNVIVNNKNRNLKHFHKICRYITQENILQNYVTVLESMLIAADFKLGFQISKQEKNKIVTEILQNLRLSNVSNNNVETLSGGERKRLAIALELINNPPIIFLDEPTSGLDEQASFMCVSLLKQLAEEGRTVICSIHSPSAKIFSLFDHIYVLSDGKCAYNGQGDQLLPFLEKSDLICPLHYNPIDFFIDAASGEYGNYLDNFVALTKNGEVSYSCDNDMKHCDKDLPLKIIPQYYTSTISQIRILLYRMYLQSRRNHVEMIVRCFMHAMIILAFSTIYYNCGNDATKIFTNISYLILSIIALMYCSLMPPLIHFPLEVKGIRNEYFNQWYNIQAFFIAKSLSVIPGCVMFTSFYVLVTYPLSDQPLAIDRMIKFGLVCVLINMISDACSTAIASVFSVVNSFFVGVAIMVLPVLFSVYGYGYPFNLHPFLVQLMLRTSFIRYAVEALVEVVYSDRPDLFCPDTEVLCPITSPRVIAIVGGFKTVDYWTCIGALLVFYVISKAGHYFLLRQRLKPGKPAEIALRIFESAKHLLVKYLS